jgi:hypothetical protein
MAMELPIALFGSYPEVTRAVRKIYAEMKKGQDIASACGPVVPIDTRPGHLVVTGPTRLARDKSLFRPHLLHDVASARGGGRELQTWLVDPLLELSWGGLCLVSQETIDICKDRARSLALVGWALRWYDELEELGPIFGDERPFFKSPTFSCAPTTLLAVVAAAGVSPDEIQDAAYKGSAEMRTLFEAAFANLKQRAS